MFGQKEHRYSVPYRGNRSVAFDVARSALLALGFEITTDTRSELHADGPGLHSSRQSPLLGVSRYRFQIGSANIRVEATLGGVRSMKVFLYLFPPGLSLLLAAVFALSKMDNWWVAVLPAAPWIVISPLMAAMIERRTIKAVDGLVRSMARAAANR